MIPTETVNRITQEAESEILQLEAKGQIDRPMAETIRQTIEILLRKPTALIALPEATLGGAIAQLLASWFHVSPHGMPPLQTEDRAGDLLSRFGL
jgi:hypothetical protein